MHPVRTADLDLRVGQARVDHPLYRGTVHRLVTFVSGIFGARAQEAGHHSGNRIIGPTIIAFGTPAPELAVAAVAADRLRPPCC
jgi:hypothetical protein